MIKKIFDSGNHNAWIIFSILTIIIGMFVSIIYPIISTLFRFQQESRVGFAPTSKSFLYLFVAFFCLTVALYGIYRLHTRNRRILSGVFGITLFLLFIAISNNQYIYVDEQYIEKGSFFSGNTYKYSEIEAVTLIRDDDIVSYEIITNKDEQFEVVFAGMLDQGVRNYLDVKIKDQGIKIIEGM